MTKIAVIDLDSVCYTIAHPEKELDEQGNPKRTEDGKRFIYKEVTQEQLERSTDIVMSTILAECAADQYIGYMKGKNTTLDRLEINSDYKANRTKEEPWWWRRVQYQLQTKWGAYYVDNMEVDDAVNITRLALPNSFICAIDGDLLGLEGTHYNWRKKEWVTVDVNKAFYNFWVDMIAGQSGDNIKGIPGKGEAYAKKLLDQPLMSGFPARVLTSYTNHFGVDNGIHEFYKNYVSLKILEKKEGFIVPQPIEVPKKEEIKSELFT